VVREITPPRDRLPSAPGTSTSHTTRGVRALRPVLSGPTATTSGSTPRSTVSSTPVANCRAHRTHRTRNPMVSRAITAGPRSIADRAATSDRSTTCRLPAAVVRGATINRSAISRLLVAVGVVLVGAEEEDRGTTIDHSAGAPRTTARASTFPTVIPVRASVTSTRGLAAPGAVVPRRCRLGAMGPSPSRSTGHLLAGRPLTGCRPLIVRRMTVAALIEALNSSSSSTTSTSTSTNRSGAPRPQ